MPATSLILTLLFGLVAVSQVTAQDIPAGEATYQEVCRNCHGPTAKGMASFPALTDRSADYIIDRLEDYRAGETIGPNTPLMTPFALELTDEDIENLAIYITTTFN